MNHNVENNAIFTINRKRISKKLTGLLLGPALLLLACTVQVQAQTKTDGIIGTPVKPIAVKVDPKTLRGLGSTDLRVFPAEGEPLPKGKTPARKPIQDPTIQLEPGAPSAATLDGADSFDQLSSPIVNVPGMTFGNGPPDTIGDIGANHYVQMINATTFQVFDKSGNPDPLGVVNLNALWQAAGQAGTICDSSRGDPTVVYDHLADRWLISQFAPAANTGMCIAISQTPDPTAGSWFLYYFNLGADPDYPKFGVWKDGYYMSSYEGANLGVFAFDRVAMINGQAAGWMKTTILSLGAPGVRDTRILPSDLDGPAPAIGTPNYFVRTVDDQQDLGNPTDRVEVWAFAVDWLTPGFTFTLQDTLSPAAFQMMLCDRTGQGGANPNRVRDCVPQPDTAQNVDALSNRPMMQLKYRNFGTHASMVFNQTIDVSGSINDLLGFTPADEVAGIRWYELRNDGASGNWTINDQSTFAPQPIIVGDETELLHRWLGSAAIDKDGNIAIGYSVSNDDDDDGEEVYPGIRYAGRLAGDSPGQLAQGEKIILNGAFSVQGNNSQTPRDGLYRWGDYSAMSVDPIDNCTFWFTSHAVNSNGSRPTQIASFKFLSCDETDLAISKSADPDPGTAGDQLFYNITVDNLGPNLATDVVVSDTLPDGVTYVTDTAGCDTSSLPVLTCELGAINADSSATFTIKVLIDADLVVVAGNATTLTNVASVDSSQQDTDESDNSVSLTIIVEDLADLKISKLCKPDRPLLAGETAICEIFIDNLGVSDARNVQVNDTHVANGNFSISSVASTQGSCNPPADGIVNCDLGVLPANVPDNRAVITIELTASQAVDINDTATVTSDTSDPDTSNNMAMGSISVDALADLAVTKGDLPDPVIAGETLTYTLDITNNGPSTAVNALIEDIVPAGTVITSVSATGGSSSCNAGVPGDSSQPTTCTFDSLANGASRTMTIMVTVLPDALGLLHNDAQVSSDTFDNNNANDLASTVTNINSESDLVVTKADSPDPVLAGAPLTYTIDVINNGPSKSLDVVLTDILPLDVVSFDSVSATNGSPCNLVVNNTVDCKLGDFSPGDTVTVFINVTVDPSVSDGAIITNSVNVTSGTNDPNTANNAVSEDTTVNAEADLWIDKTGNFPTGNPSGTILYFLTAHNEPGCSEDDPQICGNGGPSDALNVVVVDTLPLTPKKVVVEFVSENCSYDRATHKVTCTEPVLPAGTSVRFDIQVHVKGSTGEITNTAEVRSDTTDPDSGNNTDELLMTSQGGTGDSGGPGGNRGRGGGNNR